MPDNPDSKKSPLLVTAIWLLSCLVFAALVDGASEALKFVAHGVSENLDLASFVDNLLALGMTIVLVVAATVVYERLNKRSNSVLRNALIVISLSIIGIFEPWSLLNRPIFRRAFDNVHCNESIADVQNAFPPTYRRLEPHRAGTLDRAGREDLLRVYCVEDCFERLTYDVPALWPHKAYVDIDFNSQLQENFKQYLDGERSYIIDCKNPIRPAGP